MTQQDESNSKKIIPFGKHEGESVEEVLVTDRKYLEWLTNQGWFRTKFVSLHQTIINQGAEPEETPEHNALQVLFLEDAFCIAFLRAVFPGFDERVRKIMQQHLTEYLRYVEREYRPGPKEEELKKAKRFALGDTIKYSFNRRFEDCGVDVKLTINATSGDGGLLNNDWPNCGGHPESCLRIEIKPLVGDDYPAVLRQMRANRSTILFLDRYTGQGATREQFIRTFKASGRHVVFKSAC